MAPMLHRSDGGKTPRSPERAEDALRDRRPTLPATGKDTGLGVRSLDATLHQSRMPANVLGEMAPNPICFRLFIVLYFTAF